MQPDSKMERCHMQWWPMPVSDEVSPEPVRPRNRPRLRRGASRRAGSEANRTILEMLRALAQAEADSVRDLNAPPQTSAAQDSRGAGSDVSTSHTEVPREPAAPGHGLDGMSGLMLLRATIFGPEPDDIQLHCRYCNRVFRLQEGGASFEGNAACSDCEQRLNRDLVLPAVSKHRPHIYQVCEMATGPGHLRRPAWGGQGRPENASEGEPIEVSEDDDSNLMPPAIEDLQEA